MRLVTYDRGGARRLGAWVGDSVVDLPDAVGHPAFPTTMEALVARNGGTTLDAARDALSRPDHLDGCFVGRPHLLVPFLPPAAHERETLLEPDQEPSRPRDPGVDYRLELACIVGRDCAGVSGDEARRAIFGYTLMSAWRAGVRGRAARRTAGWAGSSLGPCVVTADEPDSASGRLVVRVSDEVWSEWELVVARATFADAIATISRSRRVAVGEVLGSNGLAGGRALRVSRRLPPGAIVELELEGIGVLRNRAASRD